VKLEKQIEQTLKVDLTEKEVELANKHKKAFDSSNFANVDGFFEDFEDYLHYASSRWGEQAFMVRFSAPFAILLQSSGYGKTRLIREFSRKHVTFYCNLRDKKDETGFPPLSDLADEFIYRLGRPLGEIERFLVELVMRVLDQIEEIKQTKLVNNSNWNEQDMGVEFSQIQPWSDPTVNRETHDMNKVRDEDTVADRFKKVMINQATKRLLFKLFVLFIQTTFSLIYDTF
jgi:hypothetical protein